jgi:hypothetical protein
MYIFSGDIMTNILLISDSENVKRVFESLEKKELLQLRTAATLIQADQEIAASAPEVTFVQSRISGFSGEIILRHLKKVLPAGARIILLAGDPDDLVQAQKHAMPCLDTALEDEALAGAITDLLPGDGDAGKDAATRRPAPADSAGSPQGADHGAAAVAAGKGGSHHAPAKPKKAAAKAAEPVPKAAAPAAKAAETVSKTAEQVRPPAGKPQQESGLAAAGQAAASVALPAEHGQPAKKSPRAKADASAAVTGPGGDSRQVPPAPGKLPEPAPDIVKLSTDLPLPDAKAGAESFAEIMRRASGNIDPAGSASFMADELFEPRKMEVRGDLPQPAPMQTAPAAAEVLDGVPLAEAMLQAEQKKERPLWLYALALALVCIPVFSYLAGRQAAPPEPALAPRAGAYQSRHPVNKAGAPAPVRTAATAANQANPALTAPAAPAANPAPAAAPLAAAKPLAPPAGKPAALPAAKPVPVNPPPQPAAKAGLKALPAVVAQARLDAAYGTTHPGWQRYLGSTMEYKLFREGELYRALQVFARGGESIPDRLFKKALFEFGGVDSYLVQSASEKEKYLVEQGEAKNGVALTLYRNKADRRMKAFVLYYR